MNGPLQIVSMETLSDWQQPGNVGDDNGGGAGSPTAAYTITPGTALVTKINPAAPYADLYVFRNVTVPNEDLSPMTLLAYTRQIMFPTQADINACQAFEFEVQKVCDGYLYNGAGQIDLVGAKALTTFDYNLSKWQPTYEPIQATEITPGQWYDIQALFLLDQVSHTMTHVGMNINGTVLPLNITRPATPTTESDYLHVAYQLDANASAQPYTVQQRNIGLSMMPMTNGAS